MHLDLRGRIRTVQRTEDRDFGDTWISGNKFDIRIALENNKHVDEFSATLLHELLHIWFKLVKKICRLKVTSTEEHEIIKGVESVVIYFVYLNLKQRKI